VLITIFFCAGTVGGAGRVLERAEAEDVVVGGGSGAEEEEEEVEEGAASAVVAALINTSLVATA
jgi:ABC-type sugar transport system substrate-binding protein